MKIITTLIVLLAAGTSRAGTLPHKLPHIPFPVHDRWALLAGVHFLGPPRIEVGFGRTIVIRDEGRTAGEWGFGGIGELALSDTLDYSGGVSLWGSLGLVTAGASVLYRPEASSVEVRPELGLAIASMRVVYAYGFDLERRGGRHEIAVRGSFGL